MSSVASDSRTAVNSGRLTKKPYSLSVTYFDFLSMGPFCVTRSNPTHQLTDPTQPTTSGKIWTRLNPTNNGAYSLVETYFGHRTYLVILVNQASTYPCSLLIIIRVHIKNSVITSLKTKLFKEMFKMSSAAAQQASTKAL